MKKTIQYLSVEKLMIIGFSLLLIPFWGLSFLSAGDTTWFTAFNGLIFTFLIASYLKRQLAVDAKNYLYLVGPAIYILSAVIIQRENVFHFTGSLFWATALLLFAVYAYKAKFWLAAIIALAYSLIFALFIK
ncbi:MAG: hypothetical protein JST43_08480 [Bacteroidetes bacterium]|nr:hypothetical protein [Bacteroidota bacterium]MBS1541449.1 hypothetical protein [Bacteroidota bacterium]